MPRDPTDERILISAPVGADSRNLRDALSRAGFTCEVCADLSAVASRVRGGCGAVILTQESLDLTQLDELATAFAAQPPWSAMPVLNLVSGGTAATHEAEGPRILGERTELTLVERPIRVATLVSALRTALRTRRRQYQVRDLLREREETLASLEGKVAERTATLQAVNAELEAFAYSISHDLKAPLRSIENFAFVLVEDHGAGLGEEGLRIVERIKVSANQMTLLLRDLLVLARLGHEKVALTEVDLDQLLDALVGENSEMAASAASIHVEHPLGRVQAEETLLRQALFNLLQNALKFAKSGRVPRIVVSANARDEWVRLRVADDGIGIDPRYHTRIFGLFERLEGAKYPGTGVGLTIVKRATERMGGRVGVESEVNAGACFWMDLRAAV